MIRFNGIDFSEFNTFWDGSQLFDKPEKDVTFVSVLGRNGDLTISNDRYKNLQIKVNCFIRTNFEENFSNLINFLTSVDGYARFETSAEPNTYRMATYVRAIQPKTTSFNIGGFFTLVFDCKPQRFLYEGEVPVSVENINSTRTGELISIEDTENTTSITDAKAELEPKVYHDYDSVWLAGYGKNKLKTTATEETVNGLTFSPNDDGTIEVSGTSSEALTVTSDSEIYSKRVVENGYRLFDEIVGGSIVWNQLFDKSTALSATIDGVTIAPSGEGFTLNGTPEKNTTRFTSWRIQITLGHVYLTFSNNKNTEIRSHGTGYAALLSRMSDGYCMFKGNANASNGAWCAYYYSSTIEQFDNMFFRPQIFDLTQMFGTTIADYIYQLEQSSSGSGVALFKKLFPLDYYEYNSGTMMSVSANAHETVGFNQWDEEWEVGGISNTTGENTTTSGRVRSTNYIPCFENTIYYFYSSQNASIRVFYYDSSKTFMSATPVVAANQGFTTPSGTAYIRFIIVVGSLDNIDVCINLSWSGKRNGEYEPYQKNTYSLSPLTLRGIPKLVNNKITYDGDIYKSSGEVTRRYGEVDLGSLNWNVWGVDANTFAANFVPIKTDTQNEICSKYPTLANGLTSWMAIVEYDKVLYHPLNGTYILIRDTSYTDAASFKTAMSGVKLVYELATPTTESTTPFTKPQICEQGGTEEYVDNEVTLGNRDVSIPVGHNTFYADYVVSTEAKLSEGTQYVLSNIGEYENQHGTLTMAYRDSDGMHTLTTDLNTYLRNFTQSGVYEFTAYTLGASGFAVSDTIYPMIQTYNGAEYTFEPYENIGYLEEYASATLKIEPKNIYPLENGMEYDSGLFIQINEGEVRLTGNATSRTRHDLSNVVNVTGTYIASGGIAEGNSKLIVRKINTVMGHSTVTDYDIYTEDVTIPVSRLGTTTLQFYLDVANGSGDGLVFKPMLRNPLITDSTFEKGVDGSRAELCLFDPAATGGEYSFYHRTLTETHKAIDISTLTWTIATIRGELTVFTASLPSTADVSVNVSNHYCTGMAVAYGLQSNAQEATFTIYKSGNAQSSVVYLAYKTNEVPDVATLTSLIDGIYLNYKLYTPVSTNYGPEGAIYPIENATTYFYSPYQPSDLSSIVDYHELEISYTSPTVIENPTGMKAYPLIQIVPTDDTDGYVRINGATIFVKMNGVLNHGVYFFDTEIQDAYYGDYENANQWIYTLDSSIFFKEGKNVVTFENVDRVVIYPRWWKL